MSDDLKGLFDQPIESLNPQYRDTREDIQDRIDLSSFDQPEPTPADPAPVDPPITELTTADPAPAEPVNVDPPTPVEPAPAPVQAQPKDWKQVLKEEGYDDFAIGVLEYYKSTGDLTPYVEAKKVDYTALADEEVLRLDLRKRYSELSDDEFALMYQKKVVDQYRLDEMYSDDDQRLGRIELKYAAKEIRERLIEEQKKFKAPEREAQPDQSQAIAEQMNQWKSTVDSDPITQSLLSTKRVGIGEGEQVLNFEVENTEAVLQSTYDPNQFFASFVKPDGSVDLSKWYKVVAYATNTAAFERAAIAHGKTLGRQEVVNELKNPPKPNVGTVPGGPTGNAKEDLLQEFLNSGTHRGGGR